MDLGWSQLELMPEKTKNQSGFTLLEVLLALALGLILLSGMLSVFNTQQKAYDREDQLADTMQNVRVGLDWMVRYARMSGYDPSRSGLFGFTDSNYNDQANAVSLASDTAFYFTMDDDGNGSIDNNTNEKIGYRIADKYDGTGALGADGKFDTLEVDQLGAGWQPVAENITTLTFTYTYADGEVSSNDPPGLPDNTDADTTNDFEAIRLIQISITARTDREDSTFTGGYNLTGTAADGTCRTRTLTATVRPRNLGLL